MSLKKSTGNMYPWVTHTHSHLGGECPHGCSYCYVDNPRFGRPAKYRGEIRLIEEELAVNYGMGRTIFIENCNDLFAAPVPSDFITAILAHCREHPNNTYVIQTKNPGRALGFIDEFPPSMVFGTTIESNRFYPAFMGLAPTPLARAIAMKALWSFAPKVRRFLTIEPIMDFDIGWMTVCVEMVCPEFVNIGADSKRNRLPEPSTDKVLALIANLNELAIEVRQKHNLERLLA